MNNTKFSVPEEQSVMERVPLLYSGVDEVDFNKTFAPIAQKTERHAGVLWHQNVFNQNVTLSHQQLATWVGGFAMATIAETSYRYWTDREDESRDKGDELQSWRKAVWRFAHIFPLGFAFANHKYMLNKNQSWNVMQDTVPTNLTLHPSNRPISGQCISQGLLHKLFPESLTDSTNSFLALAQMDAFSEFPNRDNPIYTAMRNSIMASIVAYPYPIPYFWHGMIQFWLSHSPELYLKYETAFKHSKVLQDFGLDVNEARYSKHTNSTKHTAIHLAKNEIPKASHLDDQVTPSDDKSVSVVHNTIREYHPSEPKKTQPIKYDYTPAKLTHSVPGVSYDDLPASLSDCDQAQRLTIVMNIGATLSAALQKGVLSINQSGAIAHKVSGRYFLSHPKALVDLVNLFPDIPYSSDDLTLLLKESCAVSIKMAHLCVKNKVKQLTLAEVHPQLYDVFFSDFLDIENNKDISLHEVG